MIIPRVALAGLGAIVAGAAAGRVSSGKTGLHDAVVKLTAAGMRAVDVVSSATQTLVDEAQDVNAEARRKARIDAAVKERLSKLEEGIRAEVTAEVDAAPMKDDE
ncbi:MAG: DUF1490 domain-containing protein [Atopobiaceae bacterium]|nr:DUF1490 domain-containing protein [Atopobiaceae bacterium]